MRFLTIAATVSYTRLCDRAALSGEVRGRERATPSNENARGLNAAQGNRISKQGQEPGEVGFIPTGSLDFASE